MCVWCNCLWSLILIHACMMHISILMHVTTMHICMMHLSMIHNPDTCMYDAYIYLPRSLTLQQACVYDAYTYDPWSCYMYVWCIYDDYWSSYMYDAYICVPQTLTLMLVCMMHISMILDSCMYEARMVHASTYDAIFFGNGHTFNGRSSSSSRSEQGYYGVGK